MSAPDGDLEKQSRHHRGPLNGMFAVVLFALVLLGALGIWAFGRGGDPGSVAGGENTSIAIPGDGEEDGAIATREEADPTAVDTPSVIVDHPQSGMDEEQNPTVGDSDAAQPLDPVEETPAATAD
jgi:hypothetical protein